jgi:hypothetical protein
MHYLITLVLLNVGNLNIGLNLSHNHLRSNYEQIFGLIYKSLFEIFIKNKANLHIFGYYKYWI